MYDLTSPKVIKYLCNKYDFRFKKGLGQNFLTDAEVLRAIVRAAEADERGVIEIGSGFGCLTAALAQTSKKVCSIELDERLLPVLKETLAGFDNIKIISGNVLKLDLRKIIAEEFGGMRVSMAANLPYYITTPIIMSLLEAKLPIECIVIMIQKEVAERILAPPGRKEYGALSVAVQVYSEPEFIMNVPASSFMPKPKVDSAVLRLKIRKEPPVFIKDEKKFFALVRAAFAQRRKTFVNAILNSGYFSVDREKVKSALSIIGIDQNARGETLSIEQFAKIAEVL